MTAHRFAAGFRTFGSVATVAVARRTGVAARRVVGGVLVVSLGIVAARLARRIVGTAFIAAVLPVIRLFHNCVN